MLFSHNEKHLGATFEIQIVSDNPRTPDIITELFAYCAGFEQEFSRFREASSLSVLNTHRTLEVSDRFVDLLGLSLQLETETGGKFSPFVDIGTLGYTHDFEAGVFERRKKGEDSTVHQSIEITGNIVTLSDNSTLDFGGIGKGYLVDTLRDILVGRGYTDFCIDGGGDIFVSGKNNEREEWVIGIEDPNTGDICSTLTLTGISIATSGGYNRTWTIDGEQYHHIIDAQTGKNLHDFLSVTIIGATTTRTDALTKAIWHTPFGQLQQAFVQYGIEGVVIERTGKIFVSPKCLSDYQFRMYP